MAWLTRFVVMVSFLALGIVVSPETFGSKSTGQMGSSAAIGGNLAVALKLAHLLSFATAWGSALWVTFIGGIIMFRTLPRHQFGNLQGKMFPAYFSMVAVCGAVCLAAFGLMHPWSSASYLEKLQLGLLVSSLVFTLTNIFIFMPMTMDMMRQRHKIEREENIGNEVGLTKNHEVAKRNPKLAEVNKKFGMIHGLSSLANLLSFGGLAMHSCYLMQRMTSSVWRTWRTTMSPPKVLGTCFCLLDILILEMDALTGDVGYYFTNGKGVFLGVPMFWVHPCTRNSWFSVDAALWNSAFYSLKKFLGVSMSR